MIQKIEKIVSIGKFKNYLAAGDVAFKKLTLFYADNGGGKTTLTSVFRSLTLNQPEIIERRKTISQTTQQAAHIIEREADVDTHHNYNATTGWNTPLSDIEIFDIHFVNDNIHSGFDFNDEQKKHLHQFVIGSVGVAIQQQLNQNKIDKTNTRQRVSNIEAQLLQDVGNNLTADGITPFITINRILSNNIDQQIALAETSLASANSNSIIQTLQHLVLLNNLNPEIDYEGLNCDLQISTLIIQDEALQSLFSSHCQDLFENSIKSPENWIRIGYDYFNYKVSKDTKETNCPFCRQAINDGVDIIKAYSLKFNEDFNALIERIKNYLIVIQQYNISSILLDINTKIEANVTRITTWSTHFISDVPVPALNSSDILTSIQENYKKLTEIVKIKQQNPSSAQDPTLVVDFQLSISEINKLIDSYNQGVNNYNAAINAFRANIQTREQAQTQVSNLKRIKKRFEESIALLCNQYVAEKQVLRQLESTYTDLSTQQQDATSSFFSSYKDRINHYLDTVFKTVYRIEDVVHVPPQGRAIHNKISYKLTIEGHDLSFDHTQPNSVKDCLSEGDKSTIALAFFLSKLDIDPGISNKILVFDDPLSSFDSNRRMYTVQLIKDICTRIKQAIVLSHNEYFLFEVSKGIAAADKKTLRISENFLLRSSIIEPLDLDIMVENEYFKHLKELEDFLQSPDLNKKEIVLGWLRNVLESHLRFVFYKLFISIPRNNQTFGNLINTLESRGVRFRDDTNRGSIISRLKLINGISCRPHHGEPIPDYATLGVNPNNMTVSELAGFIIDTLDLIENRL